MNTCCEKWNRAAVFSIAKCSGDLWNSHTSGIDPFLIQFCPECGTKLDSNTIEGLRRYENALFERRKKV